MKKRTWYNLLMVVIILSIVAGGVMGVGYIQGWFDQNDGSQAVLQEVVGVVDLERNGVSTPAQGNTVLRPGDRITAQKGATAVISRGEDSITLGSSGELDVTNPEADDLQIRLHTGELFINTKQRVKISFEAREVTVSDATVGLSARVGAQTLRVYRGTVDDICAGSEKEYVGGKTSVGTIKLESLNDFNLAQIRKTNAVATLCFTNKDLDDLSEKRRQDIQDMLNGIQQEHEHSYEMKIVSPTCTEKGYQLFSCSCGESYIDNELAATGHRFSQWQTVKVATDTQTGLAERKCSQCEEKEEKIMPVVSAGHTHSYTSWVVDPTCTEKGYTFHECICGDSYCDNEVEVRGHRYLQTVIEPSCTVNGYTLYFCDCGQSYTGNVVESTGHNWGQWQTVREATAEEDGLRERSCNVCDAKQQQTIAQKSVYITIVCNTILDNMADLNPSKAEFVPADGVILPVIKVPYTDSETVFDVLVRVCNQRNIQLEYSFSIYGSYYIEGINNLYEKDCGGDSGWMYKVNEWFPNYGVSDYKLSDGDMIVFAYTCKGYGTDVGAPEWNDTDE